jgi:CheY-like chemotaxis protein
MSQQSIERTAVERALADNRAEPQIDPVSSYILVVDDEAVVREFLSRCLERGGYTVKQAGSAAEALETMVATPASAVLCDIRMPGQDGLWLADRLHTHWPKIPVVMATAIDDQQTVQQSRRLGAVDYISKPIKPDQLLQVIRRVTAAAREETVISEETPVPQPELPSTGETKIDAEYTLETPVRCPACGERISNLKAVRLIRAQVNFTSTLPRRGRVLACPYCLAVIPAELSNF